MWHHPTLLGQILHWKEREHFGRSHGSPGKRAVLMAWSWREELDEIGRKFRVQSQTRTFKHGQQNPFTTDQSMQWNIKELGNSRIPRLPVSALTGNRQSFFLILKATGHSSVWLTSSHIIKHVRWLQSSRGYHTLMIYQSGVSCCLFCF